MPNPIGHGALGLRSNLPTFQGLMEASSSEKAVLLETRLGQQVTGWAVSAGEMYSAPFTFVFDGLNRDVVAVKTLLDQGLTRAQSQADCQATRGTYFYDPDVVVSQASWDDLGVSNWDDAGVTNWDVFAILYVHLSDGSDPSLTTVTAKVAFYTADTGAWHPDLGDEQILNPNFDTWPTGSDPTNWTIATGAGILPATRDSDVIYSANYALAFIADGSIASPVGEASAVVIPVKAGKRYRFWGIYQTSLGSTLGAELRVGSGSNVLQPDGRSVAATTLCPLLATGGEFRAWVFDYLAPIDENITVRLRAAGTSNPVGTVRFDGVSHRRIWRMVFWEPRLLEGAIPSSGAATEDVFFGGKEVGLGQLGLNNADGLLEKALGQLDVVNQEMLLSVGGALPDGDELLPPDFRRRFTGLIQSADVDDRQAQFELEDLRTILKQTFPRDPYPLEKYPGMDPAFVGNRRPLWFGARTNITPIGISKDASTGYRTYELADTSKAPNGIKSVDAVYFYEDEEAARKKDATRRVPSAYASIGPGIDTTNGVTTGANHTFKSAATAAWDSGATSSTVKIASTEDAYVECTVGRAGTPYRFMLGLALSNPDWNFTSLNYALYANGTNARYEVWELGVQKAILTVPYNQFDRIRVWMRSGVVTYYVNGVLVYTSLAAASGNYFIRTSFFDQNAYATAQRVYRATIASHTVDLTLGRITVANDGGPYRVVAGQNKIDFNSGGALVAVVQPGLYSALELAIQAGGAMAAAAFSNSFVGQHSDTTHLITLLTAAGTTLQVSSGANKGLWTLLGFTDQDRAAASSHAGNLPLFTDPDTQHVLRADGTGFKDDAAGTFTGVGSAAIVLGPDICRVLWNRYLGQPLSSIDAVSFADARLKAPAILAIYLSEETTARDIFTRLEYSNLANINIDGAGVIYYEPYSNLVPASTPKLFDRDLLTFRALVSYQDIYGTVNVYYDEDPTLGTRKVRTVTDPAAEGRWRRPNPRDYITYLTADSDAIQRSNNFLLLAKERLRYSVSGKGKMLDSRLGTKLVITRARAMSPSGSLVAQPFRILSVSHDHLAAKSTAEVVEDVALP